jgi:hypothetical protein
MASDFDEPFRPLEASGLFKRTVDTERVIYSSPKVSLAVTYNSRDGLSAYLEFPALGSGRVSLDTLVEALKVSPPGVGISSDGTVLGEVRFLLDNYERLQRVTAETYDDLCSLQFWHGITWQKKWGSTITLTSTQITAEKARLSRLMGYFVPVVSRVTW